MNQKAMDASIAVFKRMQEHKSISQHTSMDNGVNTLPPHPKIRFDKTSHERMDVLGLRADKVDQLILEMYRLSYIILRMPIVTIRKATVYDSILKLNKPGLGTEIVVLGQVQLRNEPFCAIGVGSFFLDFKRGLGFLSKQVP